MTFKVNHPCAEQTSNMIERALEVGRHYQWLNDNQLPTHITIQTTDDYYKVAQHTQSAKAEMVCYTVALSKPQNTYVVVFYGNKCEQEQKELLQRCTDLNVKSEALSLDKDSKTYNIA